MRLSSPQSDSGFSLTEVIITVAVIGILATLSIPRISLVYSGSKQGVAQNIIASLNQGTREFGHSQWDLRTSPDLATGADELLILRTLQWRDPNPSGELNFPGPFMRTDWNPSISASVDDHRAEWTGSSWRLLEPGTPGAGLKIVFDGSDLGKVYVHEAGFKPVSSH